MAIVHGEIIKEERKKRNWSQTDLANGICKQATISNIERKNFCKDIEILSKICRKLNLNLSQVVQSSPEDSLDEKLTEIEHFLSQKKFMNALERIEKINLDNIHDSELTNRYYFNSGKALLLGKEDTDGALFYFNQVLSTATDTDLYGILANTGIGVTYQKKEQLNFAKSYFTKALSAVLNNDELFPLIFNEVLYQVAKFYRTIKEYDKAIELCLKGIEINQHYQSTQYLEYLIHEIGKNKEKLKDKTAKDTLADAKKIANFNKNSAFEKEMA